MNVFHSYHLHTYKYVSTDRYLREKFGLELLATENINDGGTIAL